MTDKEQPHMIRIEWHTIGEFNLDCLNKIVTTIDGTHLKHFIMSLTPEEYYSLGELPSYSDPLSKQLEFFRRLAELQEHKEKAKKTLKVTDSDVQAVFDNGIIGTANSKFGVEFLSHVVEGYQDKGGTVEIENRGQKG